MYLLFILASAEAHDQATHENVPLATRRDDRTRRGDLCAMLCGTGSSGTVVLRGCRR